MTHFRRAGRTPVQLDRRARRILSPVRQSGRDWYHSHGV